MPENLLRLEQLTRPAIRARQEQLLAELFQKILPGNRFWGERFQASGLWPDEITTLEDLQKLPCVTKAEIADNQADHPPYGTNLTGQPGWTRLHQTSGTTGSPLRWLDTRESWAWMLGCWQQLYQLMGLRPDDRLFFAFSFGPFLGYWTGFEGAQQLGNFCIAAGGLSSEARLNLLLDNKATIICCTPTYALRLGEIAGQLGIDLGSSPVRALLVAGEGGGNIASTRARLEKMWGARVFDHWGMTELGPLAMEAENDPGSLYVLETECIAEIINSETGEPVAVGEEGELVITNLGRIGSPLIRYRTGDRVRASTSGKFGDLLRLDGGILGRVDDMFTIRGNNIYPAALENVIRCVSGVEEYRIEVRPVREMQHLRIEIEPSPSEPSPHQIAAAVARAIKERWNFHAEVVAVAVGALPRFEQKGKRFFKFE